MSGHQDAADARQLTVSVVIPVRNDARELRGCLEALAAQTSQPVEVIVIDNGSSDETTRVAREFGATVVFEPSPGIGVASAAGYDAASGDVIGRLDADSVPDPDWIATVASSLSRHPDAAAITGPAHFTDGPAWARSAAAVLYLGSYFVLTGLALGHVPLFGSNLAMRRTAWLRVRDEVHASDGVTHDDLDLSFHVGVEHPIRFVPALRTGISMRPFFDGRGMLRWRRGVHTIVMHWPDDYPWLRVGRRIARATGRALSHARSGR